MSDGGCMIYPHWVYRLEGFPENPEKWLVQTEEQNRNLGPGFTDPYGVRCPVVDMFLNHVYDVLEKLENIDMVQEHVEETPESIHVDSTEVTTKTVTSRKGWPKGKHRKVAE